MKKINFLFILCIYAVYFLFFSSGLVIADTFPDISQLSQQTALPAPLVMFNGKKVNTKEEWFSQRRPELKNLFQHYMYGTMPPAPEGLEFSVERIDKMFYSGKALKKEVTISFGNADAPRIHLLLVIPNARTRPAPVFLGLNFCGKSISSPLGYYLRPGKHSMTKEDWKIFLDFADTHFKPSAGK